MRGLVSALTLPPYRPGWPAEEGSAVNRMAYPGGIDFAGLTLAIWNWKLTVTLRALVAGR